MLCFEPHEPTFRVPLTFGPNSAARLRIRPTSAALAA